MRRIVLFACGLIISCLVTACVHKVSQIERGFASVVPGNTAEQVMKRMGNPDVREASQLFVRYTDVACVAPCAQRLWWEHPILKGVEAWSVEINIEGKVIHKARFVSP